MSTSSQREPSRRAVITGMGIVSPAGVGRAAFHAALLSGRSAVRRLTLFDTSACTAKHAAWLDGDQFQPKDWLPPHRAKRMDRCTQFAVAAARQAIADAGLDLRTDAPNPRAGISFGTALGGFAHGEYWHERFLKGDTLPPSLGLQVFPGSTQGNLAIEFGLTGPGITNANTCAAGNAAMGDALRMIREGMADVVIAGAAECPVSPMIFATFDRMKTMSSWNEEPASSAYRPYHRDRDGFVIGEGSAMFVVESLEHARRRGAVVLAEVLGYGATNEAFHMSTPEPSGIAMQTAMVNALADAKVNGDAIDYINAHASGTPANDANELANFRVVFGDHARTVPISGTKPFTGHTLGAAGAFELAVCVLAMRHGFVPPTLNLDKPDAACKGLNIIAGEPQQRALRRVLSNSLGFGGIDTSIVLGLVD